MFRLEIISCTCWACYMCEYWMLQETQKPFCPRIIIFTDKSLIWNVISDSSGVELGDAYLIGYDLLHVPWNIMGHLPVQCLFDLFSSPCESRLIRREPANQCEYLFNSNFSCHLVCMLLPQKTAVYLFCRGHCHLVDRNVY